MSLFSIFISSSNGSGDRRSASVGPNRPNHSLCSLRRDSLPKRIRRWSEGSFKKFGVAAKSNRQAGEGFVDRLRNTIQRETGFSGGGITLLKDSAEARVLPL
jgi:hypothetical protein